MIQKTGPVPVLDLAPRQQNVRANPFNLPLFLWWSLFFPQALRSYSRRFLVRRDVRTTPELPVVVAQARPLIFLQVAANATLATIVTVLALGRGSAAVGLVGFLILLVALLFVVAAGVYYTTARGDLGRVEYASHSVVAGIGGMVLGASLLPFANGDTLSQINLGIIWVDFAAIVSGTLAFRGGVARYWSALIYSVIGGLAYGTRREFVFALIFGGRIMEWLVAVIFGSVSWRLYWGHLAWLPLPGRRRILERWLAQDWKAGVHCVNEILLYSLQFFSVMAAVRSMLLKSNSENLLSRVAALSTDPADWRCIEKLSSVQKPGSFRRLLAQGSPVKPYRDALAGFWHWHYHDLSKAQEAFQWIRSLHCGEELYGIAVAIASAEASTTLEDLARWPDQTRNLEQLQTDLRSGTLRALSLLRRASAEASAALSSVAPLNRSAALNRAAGELQGLIDSGGSFCPNPEWPLLRSIARAWLEIVARSAGQAGEAVLRQPVVNPYEGHSGLPVSGSVFVGRHAAMREIETLWAAGGTLPAVILYGHRRMGKTSILRNLERVAGPKTLLVYVDMQDAGWVDHTGQLLLELADAIHKRAIQAGLDPGAHPSPERYTSLGEARRELNAFLDRLNPQMIDRRLILAIDEFELIEKGMADGRIDPGLLPYLRFVHQHYLWLALIFGGLHTLDELGSDYQSAFFGQAEHVRVGYLNRDDAMRLITQPHPDFALEYAPALREELFRLTYGQPFLIQRLCWELVTQWNERFLAAGEATPRTLELDDLARVLTDDLYAGAAYYFDGVWSNVTESERRIMEVMASREEVWTQGDLAVAAGEGDLEPALRLLRRHDVIVEEGQGIRFASELMRRWVARQRSGQA